MGMAKWRNLNLSPNMLIQDIFEESATQNHPLGSRLCIGGGKTYHYCYFSEAITAGDLCTWKNAAEAIAATELDTCLAGATTVTTNTVALTAHLAKDGGYLVVDAGTGLNYVYEVVDNTADTIYLKDPLRLATGVADSAGTLHASPFRVQESNAANPFAEISIGYAQMPFTSTYYGWLQTWGPGLGDCGTLAGIAGQGLQGAEDDAGHCQLTVVGEAVAPNALAVETIGADTSGFIFIRCIP